MSFDNVMNDADMAECEGDKVVTMMDVLQEQQDFEDDANAVLGASDDKECTYSKGYIKRQALYACLTCCSDAKYEPTARAGICLACSLACHENHELVELYTKRNFRCDCGNPKFNSRPCQFTSEKPHLNEDNKYNQNFSGLYCICSRPYPDPDSTVDDEMIQCVVCEDWLHASHLDATVPANDQYSEMICKLCMDNNDFLHDYTCSAVNVEENAENSIVDVTEVKSLHKCNDISNDILEAQSNYIMNDDIINTNGDHPVITEVSSIADTTNMSETKQIESNITDNKNNNLENMLVDDIDPNNIDSDITKMQQCIKHEVEMEENDVTNDISDNMNEINIHKSNISILDSNQVYESSKDAVNTISKSVVSGKLNEDGLSKINDSINESPAEGQNKKTALDSKLDTTDKLLYEQLNKVTDQAEKSSIRNDDNSSAQQFTDEKINNNLSPDKDYNEPISENLVVHIESTIEYTPQSENEPAHKSNIDSESQSVTDNTENYSFDLPTTNAELENVNIADNCESSAAEVPTGNSEAAQNKDDMDQCVPDTPDLLTTDTKLSENDNDYTNCKSERTQLQNRDENITDDSCEFGMTETDVEGKNEITHNEENETKIMMSSNQDSVLPDNENSSEFTTHAEIEDIVIENSLLESPNESEEITSPAKDKKRKMSEGDDHTIKKAKINNELKCIRPRDTRRVFRGATFWPNNWRQKLCSCDECLAMYRDLSVLYIIDPEDTVSAYEAIGKAKSDGESGSQYEKGLQALSSLDRVQQINALTEYNKMRDKLLDFLKSFKERKEIVKEEDIKAFFAGMKPKREPDGVYFCR